MLIKAVLVGLRVATAVFGLAIPVAKEELEPQYHRLPPLREQAALKNEWTESRKHNIANILRKYDVDAWLVRHLLHTQKNCAEYV